MKLAVSPRIVRTFGTPLVSALARSWRYRVVDEHHWHDLVRANQPVAFLLWHEAILPLLWWHRHRGIAVVVSQAREGQYLADYASHLGYSLLPGSSSRGGSRALLGAVRALQAGGTVAIASDGPRGPHRVIKPGLIRAAQAAAAWVVPLHAEATGAWRLGSWDRMMVPKPRTRVTVRYGAPFQVDDGVLGLDAGVARSESAMASLADGLLAS